MVRGRCRGPSSRCIDRAGLGWIHPAADGLGRRVAVGLGRRFLQRAAVRPAGRRPGRRARAERSHGAGFGGPLPARCRQHVAPIHTDSGWIPVELGFTLWAVCPASRAGCRGQLANGPNRGHPDLVRGRCGGRSSRCIDCADLGWIHPAADGLGRRVAVGLGRRFLQRAAVRLAGRRPGRRARAERSHGAGFGGPLPARCRQHVAPIHTAAGWIPAELGFMLWAVCPANRAGCRGATRQWPEQRSPRFGTRQVRRPVVTVH